MRAHRALGNACSKTEERPRLAGDDVHDAPVAALVVPHGSRHGGEQRVVTPEADVATGVDLRPALAYQDRPSAHGLAAVLLDAQVLRVGVAPVLGRTDALLARHKTGKDTRGAQAGQSVVSDAPASSGAGSGSTA